MNDEEIDMLLANALPMLTSGWSDREIADELGVELRRLRRALRSPRGRRRIARVVEGSEDASRAAIAHSKSLAVEALDRLRAIANGDPLPNGKFPDAHAQVKAADSILDRAGVTRETAVNVEVDVKRLQTAEIVAKLRAMGVLVDAEVLPGGQPNLGLASGEEDAQVDVHDSRSEEKPGSAAVLSGSGDRGRDSGEREGR